MPTEEYTAETVPEGFPPDTRKTEFVGFTQEGVPVEPDDELAVRAVVTYFDGDGNMLLITDMVKEPTEVVEAEPTPQE